jgi:VWFA-related protein
MRFSLLLLTALPAFEQSSPPQEGQLVTLNVIATTNKGEPVTDLTSVDIRIKEDGKSRPVAVLRFAGSKNSAGAADSAKAPLGPTVVVLDGWNAGSMTAGLAWTGVRTGFQAIQPGDPVYLYFLGNRGEMAPLLPLPKPGDPRKEIEPSSQKLIAGLDEVVKAAAGFRDPSSLDPVLSANLTFRALISLVLQMAEFPGRKNLLWVTRGVPMLAKSLKGGLVDFTPQLRGLGNDAARSQVAIYAVDESAAGGDADSTGTARAALQMLAEISGGRWFRNAFPEALATCLNDARNNYSVEYYSPLQDRKYHKIHLESARKGVHLLARDGYQGGSDSVQIPARDGYQGGAGPVRMIVLGGNPEAEAFGKQRDRDVEATEIGLRVASVSRDDFSDVVLVVLRVSPSDLLMDRSNGNYQAHLVVMPALFGGGSFKETKPPTTVDINLTQAQFDVATKEGIEVTRSFSADRSIDKARLMVFDRGRRVLGSVTVKLP